LFGINQKEIAQGILCCKYFFDI